MEWFIFWLIVNCVVGYLIGQQKNDVGSAIVVSILLGPIGWLIAGLSSGNLRKCPHCAEFVKPEATVCRHCGKDLPLPAAAPVKVPKPLLPPQKASKGEKIVLAPFLSAITIALIVVPLVLSVAYQKKPQPDSNLESPSSPAAQPAPDCLECVIVPRDVEVSHGTRKVLIPKGSKLPVVSRGSRNVGVRFQNELQIIPKSVTSESK